MNTLEKVISEFVGYKLKEKNVDSVDFLNSGSSNSDLLREALEENLKERIISEIYDAKKSEIDEYTQRLVEKERKKNTVLEIKELLWEAFFLAIFVGLLGNELTTFGEFLKTFGGESNHTLITVILIIVYTVIVLGMYILKFTKDILDKILNKSTSAHK